MRKSKTIPTSQQGHEGHVRWVTYWFAIKFALIIPIVHIHLKLFGYNRTTTWLKKFIPADIALTRLSDHNAFSASIIRSLVRKVRNRSPLSGTCLSRSLSLWWLLQRMGIDTKLQIGTRTNSKEFEVHAWIEHEGKPLSAGKYVRRRYATFDRPLTIKDR